MISLREEEKVSSFEIPTSFIRPEDQLAISNTKYVTSFERIF